jgi:hypothetical protein
MHSLSYSTHACCSYNLENLLNPCPCFHCVLTVLIRLNQNPYHLWSAHPVQQIRTFQVLCLFFTLPQTQIGSINALLLESLYIMSSSWNYVRYTQEKIAAQNNIGSNAVKNLAQDFFFYYLLHFNYSFLFSVTGNIKLLLTLILKDPWRVAFTWSKSAFMARRKWSDGLRRAGQGNPAAAKCCKIYPPSQSIQLVCLFDFHREAVTLATETLMGWQV